MAPVVHHVDFTGLLLDNFNATKNNTNIINVITIILQ